MAVRQQNKRRAILLGQENNSLIWLIAVNAIVFVLINFIKIVYLISYADTEQASALFQSQIVHWLTTPASFHEYIHKPWTILTYMFTQESFWTLISNMLWLWAFGYILQDLAGGRKLIPVYIYGGVAGATFFLISSNLLSLGGGSFLLAGANTAVLAVAVAATTLAPAYRMFPMIRGGIPLWILTAIFIAIDYAFVAGGSGSMAIAHLASCLMGYLFIHQLRRGHDLGQWMNSMGTVVNDLFNPDVQSNNFSKENKNTSVSSSSKKSMDATQQRVDEILDKINLKGIQHLSEEEKEFLKQLSSNSTSLN